MSGGRRLLNLGPLHPSTADVSNGDCILLVRAIADMQEATNGSQPSGRSSAFRRACSNQSRLSKLGRTTWPFE